MSYKSYNSDAFQWFSFIFIALTFSTQVKAFSLSLQLKSAIKSLTKQSASSLFMTAPKRSKKSSSISTGDVEDVITSFEWLDKNFSAVENPRDNDKLNFPEVSQSSMDEKALRKTPFGKILFGVIDVFFPVFKEPNWFDVYGKR